MRDARAIVLGANRPAHRFYRGGDRITEFRGDAPGPDDEPEDWIASTVSVFGSPGVGATVLPDGRPLAEAIAADPEGWLGAEHLAAWGVDPGILVKLLDAGQRLPVHAHPDGGFAREHLGHAHGKTEAWCILEGGTVHLGLREDLDAGELRGLVETQDTARMLDALHAIEVAPGDGILVPAGTLHAIGEGVLLLEVQEPEDLSILLEWRGFALDGERDGHLGLGFGRALEAVHRRRLDPAGLDALVRRAGADASVLPAAADPFFSIQRIRIDGSAEIPRGFGVVVVVDGGLNQDGTAWRRGTTAVVPAEARVALEGRGTVLLVRPGPRPVVEGPRGRIGG